MSHLSLFESSADLDLKVGSTAVVITLYGGDKLWTKAFSSVLMNTADDIPIFIFEDAYKDDQAVKIADEVCGLYGTGKRVYLHRNLKNVGVVKNLNLAFELLSPANVAVLNSDVIVGPHWLEGLEAALADPTVATVTALSTNSAIFTVKEASNLLGVNPTIEEVGQIAATIWRNVQPIFPEVPTTISCCAIFRRRALEVVGNLDEFFSPGYGEETDFSLRCLKHGFRHVAAENVLVYHEGGVSFGTTTSVSNRKLQNDKEVERRYPFFRKTVVDLELNPNHPLNVAIRFNEVLLRGLDIVIEGTLLNENHTGTFVGAMGLISGLVNHPNVERITILCPNERVRSVRSMFRKAKINVSVLSYSQIQQGDFDIGLIPHQAYNPKVFDWMKDHVKRRMVWHLDFISTSMPNYHHNSAAYFHINDVVKQVFREVDGILFLNEKALGVAKSKGFEVDSDRTFVLPAAPDIGLEISDPALPLKFTLPGDYILVLGLGFKHKNREYAKALFDEIKGEFPSLSLVFAGPTPTFGKDDLIGGDRVLNLGKVSDSERFHLIANAKIVLSPSVVEGFGLAPLEAAALNVVPVVSRIQGYESHGYAPYWIELDSFSSSKKTLVELLTDSNARAQQLAAWKSNLDNYGWDKSADAFVVAALRVLAMSNKLVPHSSESAIKLNWKGHLVDGLRRTGLLPEGSKRRIWAKNIFLVVSRKRR